MIHNYVPLLLIIFRTIMSTPINTFVTTNHNDFTWPHNRPLMIVPSQPPKNSSVNNYSSRPDVDECDCHFHSYNTDFSRYKTLVNQESQLRSDIIKINHEMTALLSKMLESPCRPEEETMKSVYQLAHEQSGETITPYRSLMAAADSSPETPMKPVLRELQDGYRNPNRFRHSAKETPHIDPAEPINMTRVPVTSFSCNEPFVGRSEYMDTIGKLGMSNSKNEKQYLEPIPSSRRRWGNRDP